MFWTVSQTNKQTEDITVRKSERPFLNSFILFCLTNIPKPSHYQFPVIYDKGEQQNIPFKKLEPENLWPFCLKKI